MLAEIRPHWDIPTSTSSRQQGYHRRESSQGTSGSGRTSRATSAPHFQSASRPSSPDTPRPARGCGLVNPRCKDDPAWFDLWQLPFGDFRTPLREELLWISKKFDCKDVEVSDPFLILKNPKILPTTRTVGSLLVVVDKTLQYIHPYWNKGCVRGNPRLDDPLKHMATEPYIKIAEAMIRQFPTIVQLSFFWNKILIQVKGDTPKPFAVPARFAGRNVAWFDHPFRTGDPILKSWRMIIPSENIYDGASYDPVHAGVRVTCADGSLSTTLGVALRNRSGQQRICVANHGFPSGGVVYHPYDEKALGLIKETYPALDVALMEPIPGVRYDAADYFEIQSPRRLLHSSSYLHGDAVFCDGYSSGPLSFTVTSTNFRVEGEPADVIKLDLYVGLFPGISNEHLVDSFCGAPMVLESTESPPGMIGQFWSVHRDTECFVFPMDALIRDGWEVDT